MKLQLDTENKTIKLESSVELSKLVETLESLLPGGKWKEFTLQTNTTITYGSYPVIIDRLVGRPWYERPWYVTCQSTTLSNGGTITAPTYTADNKSYQLKSGIYDIELKG